MNKLLFILLSLILIFSCEDDDNLSSQSSEIEVDWVLVNIPDMNMTYETLSDGGEINITIQHSFINNGYKLFFTNSSEILGDEVIIDSNGLLTFTYNEEIYSYDLSDSYYNEYDIYTFEIYLYDDLNPDNIYCDRIILNTESNYITYFVSGGWGGEFNLSTPNELIDYK